MESTTYMLAAAIYWLIGIAIVYTLYKAWPFIQAMRQKSPFFYVLPTEKNVAEPEFAPMWRCLGMFYGLILLSMAWGVLVLDFKL